MCVVNVDFFKCVEDVSDTLKVYYVASIEANANFNNKELVCK